MKIVRFETRNAPGEVKIGLVDVVQGHALDAAAVLAQAGISVPLPRAVDIIAYNTEMGGVLARDLQDLSRFDVPRWSLRDIIYLPSVESGSLRDFIAFEQHIKTVREARGMEVPPAWYEMPVYYKGNYRTLIGHEQQVNWPRYSEKMDYELELACIVGKQGIDISVEDAADYIGGYTVMNDWSARDIQMQESSVGLGPSKGKDFGTSIGPWVVTPDEFNPRNARMIARINGEVWSDNNIGNIHWSFPQMIAHTSMEETLYPGDILGSGTAGGGCGLELDRWLQPNDVVELEVEGIGVLRNRVVRRR
ncbi:MAG: fumarylacetoacetate hydrolase family protein [SAR202 cluster bacterium]|nr:fumarylacetoacetate hydrolase family protein [SAR202 cluster bacterium]